MFDVQAFGYNCPYNCGSCSFNIASIYNHDLYATRAIALEMKYRPTHERSHCRLRKVNIPAPFTSICENYALQPDEVSEEESTKLRGPIYSLAGDMGGGDKPVPLSNHTFLQRSRTQGCVICGLRSDGLVYAADSADREDFCSTAHYLEWWKTRHEADFDVFSEKDAPALELSGRPRVVIFKNEPASDVVKRNTSFWEQAFNRYMKFFRSKTKNHKG
jgi:hypothetical protein